MFPTVLAQLGGIVGIEWIILLIIVVVLLIKGPEHIPQLARAFGQARGEYEKGKQEFDEELSKGAERARLEDAAEDLEIDPEGKSDRELRAAIAASVEEE